MEELLVSKVPRALDLKNKLFGFELSDVLIVFFNLSVMNLIFGGTPLRFPMVWGSTTLFACFLYFIKRGKPDNFLQHYVEYLLSPHYRSSGTPDTQYIQFQKGSSCLSSTRL